MVGRSVPVLFLWSRKTGRRFHKCWCRWMCSISVFSSTNGTLLLYFSQTIVSTCKCPGSVWPRAAWQRGTRPDRCIFGYPRYGTPLGSTASKIRFLLPAPAHAQAAIELIWGPSYCGISTNQWPKKGGLPPFLCDISILKGLGAAGL